MKKILLTNFSIKNYTGSEIDTVNLAELFLKKGYNVDIFTLEMGNPLLENVNKKINIYDYDSIDNLQDSYDIIWAHHFPLLDYLLFNRKIKANYIHYVSLSSYTSYEALPYYYEKLTLVSTLSNEALEKLKNNKFNIDKINIFPNYSPLDYFNSTTIHSNLKNICIISNHIPNELLDFKNIAIENGYIVDIYGMGYNYQLIDNYILNKYDLVITIGKTVNYALSLGIPVYCYDRFGGDLYIDSNNVFNSFKYNFSGRFLCKKLTGEQIYTDIINNYDLILNDIYYLKQFAYDNFCFENNVEKVLKIFSNSKKFDLENFLENNKQYAKNNELFVDELGKKIKILNILNNKTNYCRVYYDLGDGFSEKDSIIQKYSYDNQIKKVKFKLPNGIKRVKIDYCDDIFVYLKSIMINDNEYINCQTFNNVRKYKNGLISLNDDPYVIIDNYTKKNISIAVNMQKIDSIVAIDDIIQCERNNEKHVQEDNFKQLLEEVNNNRIINRIKKFLGIKYKS